MGRKKPSQGNRKRKKTDDFEMTLEEKGGRSETSNLRATDGQSHQGEHEHGNESSANDMEFNCSGIEQEPVMKVRIMESPTNGCPQEMSTSRLINPSISCVQSTENWINGPDIPRQLHSSEVSANVGGPPSKEVISTGLSKKGLVFEDGTCLEQAWRNFAPVQEVSITDEPPSIDDSLDTRSISAISPTATTLVPPTLNIEPMHEERQPLVDVKYSLCNTNSINISDLPVTSNAEHVSVINQLKSLSEDPAVENRKQNFVLPQTLIDNGVVHNPVLHLPHHCGSATVPSSAATRPAAKTPEPAILKSGPLQVELYPKVVQSSPIINSGLEANEPSTSAQAIADHPSEFPFSVDTEASTPTSLPLTKKTKIKDHDSTTTQKSHTTTSHQIVNNPEGGAAQVVPHAAPLEDTGAMFVESVKTYTHEYPKFQSVEHYEQFCLVNLDGLQSLVHGIAVITQAIETVVARMLENVGPNDFVQIRLDGGGLNRPLFTKRSVRDSFDGTIFLENLTKLLQSKAEVSSMGSLKIITLVVRPREGGAYRQLKKTLFSQVIEKKRRWLLNFKFEENICLAASVIGLLEEHSVPDCDIRIKALKAHVDMKIPPENLIDFNDLPLFEKYFNVRIKIVYYSENCWKFYPAEETMTEKSVYVLYHENHYSGIRNLKSFLGAKMLCLFCYHIYNTSSAHKCKIHCQMCQRDGCVVTDSCLKCSRCKGFARSKECLDKHIEKASKGLTDCHLKLYCQGCGKHIREDHQCNGRVCHLCKCKIDSTSNHICYLTPGKSIPKTEDYIVFDVECMQETSVHEPNYIYAKHLTGDKSWEFEGLDCMASFIRKFVNSSFKGYTFIAHNSKGYDSYFILKQLIKEKVKVKLIMQGTKLMLLEIPTQKIRFIDSLNFMPMKLRDLPNAFGFPGSKGFFPHLFNTAANQNYVGPMPSVDQFGIDCMMPAEKEEFLCWYDLNKFETFDFCRVLKMYCQEDVNILVQGCNLFRDYIINLTKSSKVLNPGSPDELKFTDYVDPFQCITLPSVCLTVYKNMFLQPETIALVPPDMYSRKQKRFSTASIQWLMYLSEKENIPIKHALRGGEEKVGSYYLDGYAVKDGIKTAFEFNGCFFHGCPKCYQAKNFNSFKNTTFGTLYNHTLIKKRFLERKDIKVITLWEHEWLEMLANDDELICFLKHTNLPEPLQPRDAMYGGRTNAIKLHHCVAQGEKIHYVDFTSLYPSVNNDAPYPVGHPHIIYENFGDLNQYFGLIKCQVYPPKELYFPVLPYRVDGKLMFPLCRACAKTKQTTKCMHSDEERSMTGTWCSVELQLALQKGYKVGKIHEIWNFEQKSRTLFSDYIKAFLIDKQEASGYPDWCSNDALKQKYIDDYLTHEGIQLRADNIEHNPARRQMAKLCLNSLWGKFAQRTNLPNVAIITDPDELYSYLFDASYDISSCEFIDEDTVCLCWQHAKEYPTLSNNRNIFIACFTTAHARLELYKVMDKLQERCLYVDTDSAIFVSSPGEENPELGDYLGDLTSELAPNDHIVEFVSAGPKTYSYRTSAGEVCMKVKGITLNVCNSIKINFESLKDLVSEYMVNQSQNNLKTIVVEQPIIARDKKQFDVTTCTLQKTLRVVFDKRVLTENYMTLPYGY